MSFCGHDSGPVVKGHKLGLRYTIPYPEVFMRFRGRCQNWTSALHVVSSFLCIADAFRYNLERPEVSRTFQIVNERKIRIQHICNAPYGTLPGRGNDGTVQGQKEGPPTFHVNLQAGKQP